MDGTLLNSEKRIPDETVRMMEKAERAGLQCALGTGRCLTELAPYGEQLAGLRYAVLESGGLVYDLKEKRILHRTCFRTGLIEKIVAASLEEDVMIQFMAGGEGVAQASDISRMPHYRMEAYQKLYQETIRPVPDIRSEALRRAGEIEKINVFHVSPEARKRTRERLRGLPVEAVDAEQTSVEFSPMGVNKGRGLLDLCEILHRDLSECAAVGDADNDLTMLGAAGFAVAMGNANEHVKKIADIIVADNDHGGCAEAMRRVMAF